MAQRTAAEMIRDLMAAGFSRANAIVMAAIGLAESGGNDTAQGDLGLQTDLWGPSYGLYQIRTEKPLTGTGQDRDLLHLAGNDAEQANAAYDISHGGADFTPWSTYTSGAYVKYLDQATAAASGFSDVQYDLTGNPLNPLDPSGPVYSWLIPKAAQATDPGSVLNSLLQPVRNIAVEAVFAGLGITLLIVGAVRLVAPSIEAGAKKTVEVGKDAAKVAAVVA